MSDPEFGDGLEFALPWIVGGEAAAGTFLTWNAAGEAKIDWDTLTWAISSLVTECAEIFSDADEDGRQWVVDDLSIKIEQIPERATAVEPGPKPPEAGGCAVVDDAGSPSEAGPAERSSGSATRLSRPPGDSGTLGRAEDAGGSPSITPGWNWRVESPKPDHPGAGAEPAAVGQSPSLGIRAAGQHAEPAAAEGNGRTAGSIPATGATPTSAEPAPPRMQFPRGVEKKTTQLPNNPLLWPPATRDAFIDAAARGATETELSKICGRPRGSIFTIKGKIAPQIELRRIELRKAAPTLPPPGAAMARTPVNGSTPREGAVSVAREPEARPQLSVELLNFVRLEVQPMLSGTPHKITKSRDGTSLELDGKLIEADALIARVNEMLDLEGDEVLTLPANLSKKPGEQECLMPAA